jgi:hypothetical protein
VVSEGEAGTGGNGAGGAEAKEETTKVED